MPPKQKQKRPTSGASSTGGSVNIPISTTTAVSGESESMTIAHLQRDLAIAVRRQEVTSSVMDAMRLENRRLNERIQVLEQEASQTQGVAASSEEEGGQVAESVELTKLRRECDDAQTELAAALKDAASLRKQLATLAKQLVSANDDLSALNNDFSKRLSTATDETRVAREESHALSRDLDALRIQLTDTLKERDSITLKCDTDAKLAKDLRAQIKSLESHANQAAVASAELKSQLAQSRERGDSKAKSLDAHVQQLQDLVRTRDLELLQAQLEKSKQEKECQDKAATISNLRSVVRTLETSIASILAGPLASSWKVGLVAKGWI
ncbi:hypothetical protein HDU98_005434 [Podochytrium sp. JEL0797]|nr:hypothetical protein HDU98_005434 [Podochytrium sp. JEL0797]